MIRSQEKTTGPEFSTGRGDQSWSNFETFFKARARSNSNGKAIEKFQKLLFFTSFVSSSLKLA